ncbi:unnamed protein product [Allacma fusca]|uniref:Uncharacterized protein n=1 Tax=Allacma fusca TaxID=39272 RepID=A0A8J2PS52_9HEXA|nr:unnamed protein product [Allacma fusca]
MCYTNKKYSFTLCLLISIVVTCNLSHGKQSPIRPRPSRVIRDIRHPIPDSTDENDGEMGEEITTRTSDSDISEVTLTPSRVSIKPTVTVTATRIGMSRYFSTSLPSPANDGNVEETSSSAVPATPTPSPQISLEKQLEANVENLLPTATENVSIITPQAAPTAPDPPLIMQKFNSSEETEDKKEDERAPNISEEKVDENAEEKALKTTDEKPLEKPNPLEDNSEWDILDSFSNTDNEIVEPLPDPIPLVSPTEMADLEDSQLEEDLAEVFNNERKTPRRRRFRNNKLSSRRLRKVKVPRNDSNPFPTDNLNSKTGTNSRPNSFNQGDHIGLPKRVGNPRMTRRFRSTTTTTTNPSKFSNQASGDGAQIIVTKKPLPYLPSFGSTKGRITPVLLTSPIISSFHDRIKGKIEDKTLDKIEDRLGTEPQIERPTGISITEKNEFFEKRPDGGSGVGEKSKLTVASENRGSVHNNETGEWLHTENSKHHDVSFSVGQFDEREDWEKNYMKLQQNSFFPSAEMEDEPAAIITIEDIPNHSGNVSSSSRQGLINNPESDATQVIIEHHHHHDGPDSMVGFFPDKSTNTHGETPTPNKYGSEGPSIFEQQSFSSPPQTSNGHEYFPTEITYPTNSPPSNFNPYSGTPEAPPVSEFLTSSKPTQGSHFDRTKVNLVAHSVGPSSSELSFMDKPIYIENPHAGSKTKDAEFNGIGAHTDFFQGMVDTMPPINKPLSSPSYQGKGYPKKERRPTKPPKRFNPSSPDNTFNGPQYPIASNGLPVPRGSGEFGPSDQSKQGTVTRSRSPMEDHFKSMRNSIIFKPPPQSNFPIFESSMPNFSSLPSGGLDKFPSNFKDQNNVIEIHHHHFPDGSTSVFSENMDDIKFAQPSSNYPNSKETTWSGIPNPSPSSQPPPEMYPKRFPPPENLQNPNLDFLKSKKRNPGGPPHKNPIASSDFSGSHGSITSYGYGLPPSPPMTLPMPGLVNIPTPPPESYAMKEVTPNQHFPPHTHSMSTYSDYEPANPPLPSGHALGQHFDHFVQNAGEFHEHSEEHGKHSGEKLLTHNPPVHHLSQSTRQKHNFGNQNNRGKPDQGHYKGYSHPNPSEGNYFEKDPEIQGNIEQYNLNDFGASPSLYPYPEDKNRPYDIFGPKPDNGEYKQQFQSEHHDNFENSNKLENNNNYENSNTNDNRNKYGENSINEEGYKYNHGEDSKKPGHNELLNNFKDIAETVVKVKENEGGKSSDGITPYSETPYIIMFPNMYPKKGNPPPPPRPPVQIPPALTTEASTIASEHFSANPEKLLGPGMKVVPVHPRHQIMKALAAKQYLKKLEALQLQEKRPPNTIFTPYGVLVPMGISSPATLASQASSPPKLATLLTSHSPIPSRKPGKGEAHPTNLPTDEKALLSLLLGSHLQQQGRNGEHSKATTSAMDSALDSLAEKLAARLSPLEDVVSSNNKKSGKSHGHQQSYGNQGSYSELTPVKTSVGEDGNRMSANGTIRGNSHNNGQTLFASVSSALQAVASEKHNLDGKEGKESKASGSSNASSSSKYLKNLLKERLVEMLQERYKEVESGSNGHKTTTGKGFAPSPQELESLKRKENPMKEPPLPSLPSPLKAMQSLVTNPFALGSNPVPTHVKPNSPSSHQQQQIARPHAPQPGGILNAIKRLFSFGRPREHHAKMNLRKHGNATVMTPDRVKNRQDFPPRNSIKHLFMPHKGKLNKFDFKQGKNERPIFPSMYGFKSAAEMEKMLKYLLKSKAMEDDKLNVSERLHRKMGIAEGNQEVQKQPTLGFFKGLDNNSKWVPRQPFVMDGLSASATKPNPLAVKVIPASQLTTAKFQPVKTDGAETAKLKENFTPTPLAYPANLLPGQTNGWKPMPDSLSYINSLIPQGSTTSAPSYLTNLYASLNPSNKITISTEYSGHRIQPRSLIKSSSRA